MGEGWGPGDTRRLCCEAVPQRPAGTKLTIRASVLVSFGGSSANPFTLGLAGCSLSESTITSGEGGLLSDFMSLWGREGGC